MENFGTNRETFEEELRLRQASGAFSTAAYDHIEENPFLEAKSNPLSTFSIDVDTASYSNVRRFINEGTLPPKDAVRVEELGHAFRVSDRRAEANGLVAGTLVCVEVGVEDGLVSFWDDQVAVEVIDAVSMVLEADTGVIDGVGHADIGLWHQVSAFDDFL